MNSRTLLLATQLAVTFLWAGVTHGQGTTFTYQGQLADNAIPANGVYDLRFAIYDSTNQPGTIVAGPLTNAAVAVSDGLFTVMLDFGLGVFTGGARWLEIGVRTNGGGPFATLSPRQPLTPVPYAMFASGAGTATTAASVPWTALTGVPVGFTDGVDNDTLYSAGLGLNLGSGNLFSVNFAGSGASVSAARSDHDHLGQSWSGAVTRGLSLTTTLTSGTGVAGLLGRQGTGGGASLIVPSGLWGDSSDGQGVLGTTAGVNCRGVLGWNFGTNGLGTGVQGQSASSSGRGVWGLAYAKTGTNYGVYGQSDSADGFGGYFVNGNGGADTAVRALADNAAWLDLHPSGQVPSAAGEFGGRVGLIGASTTNGRGYGIVGLTPTADGYGLYGWARSDTGSANGAYGRSDSTSGSGVFGYAKANSGTNFGVYGESESPEGYGVYGANDNGVAIKAGGSGIIQSAARSYFFAPGGLLQRSSSSSAVRVECLAFGARLYSGGVVGDTTCALPITVPAVFYGQNVTVKSFTVYYRCENGANNYITATSLSIMVDADTAANLISEANNHTSNTASSYTLYPLCCQELSRAGGGLMLLLTLHFANDTDYINIGGVRVELSHE